MTIGKSGPRPAGQAEERGVMSPGLDRDLDPDGSGQTRRPGAGDIDHDRRIEPAAVGLDAGDRLAVDGDRLDPTAPDEPGAEATRRLEEPGRRARWVGVAGPRLPGGRADVVRARPRDERRDLGCVEHAGVDADGLLDRDVGTHLGGELRREQVHEAGPHEPAIAGPHQLGPRLEIRERRPRQTGVALEVVVHPDEPGRSPGGAGGDAVAFQDQHRDPPPREMEGEAGPLHARPDHDHVGRLGHEPMMPHRPGRGGGGRLDADFGQSTRPSG